VGKSLGVAFKRFPAAQRLAISPQSTPAIAKAAWWRKHLHFRLTLHVSGYFTVSVNVVLWLNEPEVPVKVRV
jgi:hypothetical protein